MKLNHTNPVNLKLFVLRISSVTMQTRHFWLCASNLVCKTMYSLTHSLTHPLTHSGSHYTRHVEYGHLCHLYLSAGRAPLDFCNLAHCVTAGLKTQAYDSVVFLSAVLMLYRYRSSEMHRLYRGRLFKSLEKKTLSGANEQLCLTSVHWRRGMGYKT